MTISAVYERYLSHFRETVTLKDFNSRTGTPGLCALRHDVDHDLDLALEMAHKEHRLGFKATYFILPSAPYWKEDARLLDKCLQFRDYGHEVGLHVNCMAEWVSGATNDIKANLAQQLAYLRNGGVDVVGIAAHGDKLCYEHNLSNYWCFEELRPNDPYTEENGRTAEGPFEADMTPRLMYPKDHVARRPDGQTLPLWSVKMSSLGLDYHAWHTKFDRYFSDSTGGWRRTPDPVQVGRGNDRWQVLIHPEHWRGPKKYYFFLSSARSGSKWLSEVLSAATPLHARHEYVLNQPFHREETSRKATTDVWALEDRPDEVAVRLTEAWEEFEGQSRDFAEVNVYLENFVSHLKAFFPEAVLVQLHRDPKLVVSSLMDRNWYDTPEDRRHPRLQGVDAKNISQFERVCHYVAQVEKRLSKACTHRLNLEDLTSGQSSLSQELCKLDIAYHPRLGEAVIGRISNARKEKNFPDPDNWNQQLTESMQKILNGKFDTLYAPKEVHVETKRAEASQFFIKLRNFFGLKKNCPANQFRNQNTRIYTQFCKVSSMPGKDSLHVDFDGSARNAYFSLGGSTWDSMAKLPFKRAGWPTVPGKYIGGCVNVNISNGTNVVIYAISYAGNGKQLYKRNLGILDKQNQDLSFAFTTHPQAKSFDVIAYIPKSKKDGPFELVSWELEFRD